MQNVIEAVHICPDITLGQLIATVIGALGLIGLIFAYKQLRLVRANSLENSRSTKARFILDLNKWFNEDDAEKAFFYRLDYSQRSNTFKFDPQKFPHSDDERYLDALLYKLNHVGTLLRRGVIAPDDVGWIKHIAVVTLKNPEVIAYLEWLTDQIPDHSSFTDAIVLVEQLCSCSGPEYQRLAKCLGAPFRSAKS